ncbi:EAL domain-containing protein [Paraburkholderia fungorum]|uniref:EAL domain-containing protein n=1 Tax=Paraburkholderia fungorum TaxID=134537 RepID=UPI0038B93C3E
MALSELERRVREGLRAGEFHLVFQGVYRTASGTLARLEAQVRWTHPDYGVLLPGIFMMPLAHPQVEREMTLFVIDSVCRELRGCLSSKMALPPVAITVPAQVAVLETFAGELADIARSYGVPANRLEIEVPDSADAARLLSLRTLTAGLRSTGAGIALGKWGSGASSLALLGALDVDTITLAPELMAAVPCDPRACVVISAVLDLLDVLDVQVVVNGVETRTQLQWLSSWPKALAQGFLFSRPQAGLASVLAPDCEP